MPDGRSDALRRETCGVMRFDGKLSRWNDQRGFGFITPTLGGEDVFVHVSAFPRDGQAPRLHEPLSFEVESNKEGKKRATRVRRPGRARPFPSRATGTARPRPSCRLGQRAAAVALAVALGAFGFTEYSRRSSFESPAPLSGGGLVQVEQSRPTTFQCDGRIHCSQMSSCSEARYFLANCPGTKMDGDGDGVPCEQQWCTGAF